MNSPITAVDFFSAKGMGVTTNVPGARWGTVLRRRTGDERSGVGPQRRDQTLNGVHLQFRRDDR